MDIFVANLMLNFQDRFQNAENQAMLRLEYKLIRDRSNPMSIPDEKFVKLFRLNKYLAVQIFEEIREFMEDDNRINKIPVFLQFLAALNFYGSGSFQTCIGQDLNIALSQPVVSRCLNKISNIFTDHLLARYVKFPVPAENIRKTKQGFQNKFHFPCTIGAIDCTHVAIVTPKDTDVNNPAVAYLNRKGYHSINVQAICNSELIFTNINARYPGATHDAAIWQTSTVNAHLQTRYFEGERGTWLIGDSGYPLQPWMMTPIPDAAENTPEGIYTARHKSARNVIERAFGVLKQRFKCLKKTRVLYYDHGTAGRIIYSCIVLHNKCRQFNLSDIDEEDSDDDDANENSDNDDDDDHDANPQLDINQLTEGRLIRRQLINML